VTKISLGSHTLLDFFKTITDAEVVIVLANAPSRSVAIASKVVFSSNAAPRRKPRVQVSALSSAGAQ